MKIICVDDEALILQLTVSMCREMENVDGVEGFTQAEDALSWLDRNFADVALLDMDMPTMDGLTLAAKIKERRPQTVIIFLTGYAQYAVDAFKLHVSGYLMKPVSKERLAEEIDYALNAKKKERAAHVKVRTFGNFDIFVDGQAVVFSRSKAKELLAYLIDREGSSVTRAEAFSVLWEDDFYDRAKQKQMDVVVRSLRTALQEYGISDIFEMRSGSIRVKSELLECDLYRFCEGDIDAVNAYRGEYMSAYSWASLTEAYLDRIQRKRTVPTESRA